MSKNDVFISYSSKDEEKAISIRDYLSGNRLNCWMAPESIDPGLDYSKVIADAIKSTRVFLLLISDNSQNSQWVSKELSYALSRKLLVFPYKIQNCDLTDQFCFYLSDVQTMDYNTSLEAVYQKISNAIEAELENDSNVIEIDESAFPGYFGPERPSYAWENRAQHSVFNSITNNPAFGDERYFVRIGEVLKDEETVYGNDISIKRGRVYEVLIYYHNNSDPNTVAKKAIGIADGAAIRATFPAVIHPGKAYAAVATILDSDSSPREIWAAAKIVSDTSCYLRYIPGSAVFHNNGNLDGQNAGPDFLFGVGSLIGYNKVSGILPGGEQYAGCITYRFFVDYPSFDVHMLSTRVGSQGKKDIYMIQLRYDNTGSMDQERVVMKAILDTSEEYINGSCVLSNNNFVNGKAINDDIVSEQGVNIGTYAGGSGWAQLTYKVMLDSSIQCNHAFNALVRTSDENKTVSAQI